MVTTVSVSIPLNYHPRRHLRRHLHKPSAENHNYPIQPFLSFSNYSRCNVSLSVSASHSSSSSQSPAASVQNPLQTGRFLTNKELESLEILGNYSYHQQLESGFLWVRVMREEEMDITATLLSESFAESILIPNGYAKLLGFLVKNYLIERRETMPHCATLLGVYRENGEDDFELAGTVELTFDKKGYNASPPSPTPPKNSPYICNMAVRNPLRSFNDPLYLHPSDAPGISLVLDPLIGTENYGVWHRAMKLALHAKNKVGFVTGDCKRPAADSPTLYQWERCNAVVLSWLLSSVSKEIYYGLVYSTDASSVWADLKERFDKICGSRIYALHREIVYFSQGTSTISVYFCKLRQLWDEYASLVILPSCACPVSTEYVKHDQHQRLIQFLMGLNESYGAIRSQILLMDPLPSVNQAYSLICQEETHRNVLASHPIADAPTTAFYSSSKRFDNVKCDNCHIPGHTINHCFRLIGYPPGHKLHKRFPQVKSSKSAHHTSKVPVSNSSVSQGPSTESGSMTSPGAMFTPSQYDQILRLLAASPASNDVTANLAGTSNGLQDSQTCPLPTGSVRLPNGTLDWEDHGDW